MEYWWESLLGKPWSNHPEPPSSFNCGELIRYCYKKYLKMETNLIPRINTQSVLACSKSMIPEMFDLVPLDRKIRDFDVCMLGRKQYHHCGMACFTKEGLKILHCPSNNIGVCLSSELELKFTGFPSIKWFRHKDLI